MIKKTCFLFILLTACSCTVTNESISSNSYFNLAYLYFFAKDSEDPRDQFEQIPYSFVNFKFSKNFIATLVLSNYNNGKYRFVSADNSLLFINDYLITESRGFSHDFKWNFSNCLYASIKDLEGKYSCNGNVTFTNPDLVFASFNAEFINLGLTEINYLGDELVVYKLEIIKTISSIKWKHSDYLYVSNGRLYRFSGKLHPHLDVINLDFYYK